MPAALKRDIDAVIEAMAAIPDFAQLQETTRQANLLAGPVLEVSKRVSDDVLSTVSKALNSCTPAGMLNSVLGDWQLQGVFGHVRPVDLPTFELGRFFDEGTLAASFKLLSSSQFTQLLASASIAQELTASTLHRWQADLDSGLQVPIAKMFDGLSSEPRVASEPFCAVDIELDAAGDADTERDVASQAGVLFVILLATAVAATPEHQELIIEFGRLLLEEAVFLGQSTHDAYVRVSEAMPDDNVLGWVMLVALAMRWLRGKLGPDEPGPEQ